MYFIVGVNQCRRKPMSTELSVPTLNAVKNPDSVLLRGNDMVNYFNFYFVNVISQLVANHTAYQNIDPLNYINFNSKSFFFFPSTNFEVETVISQMKCKPTNLHDIPLNVLKFISKPLSLLISHIICITYVSSKANILTC